MKLPFGIDQVFIVQVRRQLQQDNCAKGWTGMQQWQDAGRHAAG